MASLRADGCVIDAGEREQTMTIRETLPHFKSVIQLCLWKRRDFDRKGGLFCLCQCRPHSVATTVIVIEKYSLF